MEVDDASSDWRLGCDGDSDGVLLRAWGTCYCIGCQLSRVDGVLLKLSWGPLDGGPL